MTVYKAKSIDGKNNGKHSSYKDVGDCDRVGKLKAHSGSWCKMWLSVAGWEEEAAKGLSQLSSQWDMSASFIPCTQSIPKFYFLFVLQSSCELRDSTQ